MTASKQTTEKKYDEKRSLIRLKIDSLVTFTIHGKLDTFRGRCRNLSGTGMLLETNEPLQEGEQLQVTIPSEKSEKNSFIAAVEVIRLIEPTTPTTTSATESTTTSTESRFAFGVAIREINPE